MKAHEKKKEMAKKMSSLEKKEAKGLRYKAVPTPQNYHNMNHADKVEYYKHNKGQYVSNKVNPKTGRYFNTD